MILSDSEMKTVEIVMQELSNIPYSELNMLFGSQTCKEIQVLGSKFRYADFCERHHIKYEDMSSDDFVTAYFEHADEEERWREED